MSKLVFACGEVLIVQMQHGETAEGIFCPDSSNNRHVSTDDLMSVELITAALWKHTNITSINAEQAVKTYGECVSAGHALNHATLFTRKELTLAQLCDGIFSRLVKLYFKYI